jgi:hypothetical protein
VALVLKQAGCVDIGKCPLWVVFTSLRRHNFDFVAGKSFGGNGITRVTDHMRIQEFNARFVCGRGGALWIDKPG